MTEFGRTVRVNGTKGTDHGTASVAFVLGGAVAGGRVAGTWPGLGAGAAVRGPRPAADHRSSLGGQGAAGAASWARRRAACCRVPRQFAGDTDAGAGSGLSGAATGSRVRVVCLRSVCLAQRPAMKIPRSDRSPTPSYPRMRASTCLCAIREDGDGRRHGHDDVYVHLRWRIDPDEGSLSRNRERQRE